MNRFEKIANSLFPTLNAIDKLVTAAVNAEDQLIKAYPIVSRSASRAVHHPIEDQLVMTTINPDDDMKKHRHKKQEIVLA